MYNIHCRFVCSNKASQKRKATQWKKLQMSVACKQSAVETQTEWVSKRRKQCKRFKHELFVRAHQTCGEDAKGRMCVKQRFELLLFTFEQLLFYSIEMCEEDFDF